MRNPFMINQVERRSFPKGALHNFYIYGSISSDINDYVDMITIMDLAEEGDEIHLYINTPGGALETTISIIHAIARTQASVITHADGQVASAGTTLFFAGHNYVVYPYSHFMLHDGSAGIFGKMNENLKNAEATSKIVRRICHDVYYPCFSEEEIDNILEGRDYYCDAYEIVERINAGAKIVEELQEETEQTEAEPQEESTVPFDEGSKVTVDNINLESHGSQGIVNEVVSENIRKVVLSYGKKINIHIRNLKYR